jgi:hypothetical protein
MNMLLRSMFACLVRRCSSCLGQKARARSCDAARLLKSVAAKHICPFMDAAAASLGISRLKQWQVHHRPPHFMSFHHSKPCSATLFALGLLAETCLSSRAPEPENPYASNYQRCLLLPPLWSSLCRLSYLSCETNALTCSSGARFASFEADICNHHDAQHRGVSCCYLGSGQTDPSVTAAALAGAYRLVYACPETLVSMQARLHHLHQV